MPYFRATDETVIPSVIDSRTACAFWFAVQRRRCPFAPLPDSELLVIVLGVILVGRYAVVRFFACPMRETPDSLKRLAWQDMIIATWVCSV